jgi:DNA-binding MarR family transcriptional regulator
MTADAKTSAKTSEKTSAKASVAATAEALRSVVGRLKRRLREQGTAGDLTSSQISVLRQLYGDGPLTVTALARAEAMRPQSMGATVASLQEAGLVAGAPDPADGRQTLWSLTPACRKTIEAGRAARQDWLVRAIEATLTPDEQALLAKAMSLLDRVASF